MKINFKHNLDKLLNTFENFPQILRSKLHVIGSSKTFASEVQLAISSEIDKLGFMSRAIALKKSFKILSPEVTPNGILYRIRSENPQITKLDSGTAPDARYTMGAKQLADGTFSGVVPTRIGDKIGKKVYKILYEHIADAVNGASKEIGF